jgi:hypothetical protein
MSFRTATSSTSRPLRNPSGGRGRNWRPSTRQVAIALPASHVITKKIIVAAGQREEELEVLVESEANQYIPFALDEVNLDFQVVGPAPSSPDEIEVLIAASRKEKVEDRVAVAESAGLKPVVLDVESYAVLAAFELIEAQLPERGKGQIIALVDVGANVMNLTVLRNGQQLYVREQAFGGNQLTQDIARLFGMSFEEAEAEKRRNNLPEKYEANSCGHFLRPGAGTVACPAVLLHFDPVQPDQPYRPGRRLCSHCRAPTKSLLAHTDQHHHCQSVCRYVAFRPGARQESADRCFVIDGRLRSCAAEIRRMIRINLLPHREEKRRARRQQFYALLGLVTVLSGLIVFLVYSVIAGYISNQDAKKRLSQEGNRRP